MNRILRQLSWLLHRRKRDAELQEELSFHLEAEAEERQADGLSAEDARYAAHRDLGNVALVEENTREAWGWVALEHLWQDLRYGYRGLRRNPAFTATAVLSLALGIGANTAIFSLIDALMLRWLPVRDPRALVQVQFADAKRPGVSFSYPIVRALAERKDIFEGVAGFSGWSFNVGAPGSIITVPGAMVTGGYYQTLGLNPAAGRLLSDEDDRPGAPLVAVVSYGYWERQYQRSPEVVGRTIRVDGVPATIIGVSPPGFVGANVGQVADITMPASTIPQIRPPAAPLLEKGNFWLRILARRQDGSSLGETQAHLTAVWPQIAPGLIPAGWPASQQEALEKSTFDLVPGGTGWSHLRERFQKPLLILMVIVVVVLVIACANVANLLLARATARQREIAVRLAIGASRGRIIRQFLTESSMLSVLGAALGVALAWNAGRVLLNILSSGRERVVFDLTPSWHVLAFTTAVAVATVLVFGLAPAFQSAAVGPTLAYREDSRMSRALSLQSLVTLQVALSVLLLIGAGLFVRTLQNLEKLDPGFQREGVLVVNLQYGQATFPKEMLDEIARIPGVSSASVSTHTPLNGSTWSEPAVPQGQPLPEKDNAYFIGAGPRFFETLQMRLLAGREINEHDSSDGPKVAVVNEAYASRYFPHANPVGRHLSAKVNGRLTDLEIVGLVRNAALAGLRQAAPPAVYVAYYQVPGNWLTTLEVRVSGSLSKVASAIQAHLQPRLRDAIEVQSLSAQVEATLVQERLLALLASMFGGLALVLSFVGLYGLLAYRVVRRTREIGIRMALGARKSAVITMVVGNALVLVLLGIALGVPAAIAASRWVKSMLFGLTPADPATMAGTALLLIAAALAAAYFPARRAANVDPMTALRHE